MPQIQLSPLCEADLNDLLVFELDNRAFFESHINARPADYYSVEGIKAAIAVALLEAAQDKAYQFLVRSDAGVLVGRTNLTKVRRRHFHSAELGYRVAQSEAGNGYASEAVRQVVTVAFGQLSLARLEATAKPENAGSVKVLQRNAFSQFGRSTKSFELSGVWYDLLHFERLADAFCEMTFRQGLA